MRPNVRLEDTGVAHAHARSDRQITRCGVEYIRDGQARMVLDNRRHGTDTEDPVDCMTCLTKSEWSNADVGEFIVETSIKDIQESVDVRYLSALEWQNKKRGSAT